MNLADIKAIPIEDYLSRQGFQPVSKTVGRLMYRATWDRRDTEPSVCVYKNTNTFKDYGSSSKGTIVDMVMAVEKVSAAEAIRRLSNSSFVTQNFTPFTREPLYEVTEVSTWWPQTLRAYFDKRRISKEVYEKYTRFIRFRHKRLDKELFGIGFQNNSGGWEIRTTTTKTSISPKTYTTINPGKKTVSVFEGFFDFMSAVEYYGREPKNTVVVLNSTSFVTEVDWGYERAFSFLDNDDSGTKATKLIPILCTDMRYLYEGYNDFNAFIEANTF